MLVNGKLITCLRSVKADKIKANSRIREKFNSWKTGQLHNFKLLWCSLSSQCSFNFCVKVELRSANTAPSINRHFEKQNQRKFSSQLQKLIQFPSLPIKASTASRESKTAHTQFPYLRFYFPKQA